MPKRIPPPTKRFPKPSNAPLAAADEPKAYRDDPLAPTIAPDNLYDAIRAEVDRLGGGFIIKPLKRYRHRSPRKFHPR